MNLIYVLISNLGMRVLTSKSLELESEADAALEMGGEGETCVI